MSFHSSQFREIALVGLSRIKLRTLAGFDNKIHSAPTKIDERSTQFVSKVAATDVELDLETNFQRLRKAFKLKRVEVKVSAPEPGWGTIETPSFVYSIHAALEENDVTSICFERSVREIQDPDQIGSKQFASIFDFMFDRIEFEFQEPLSLEDWIDNIEDQDDERMSLSYDSAITRCTLNIQDVDATIAVSESKFAIIHPRKAPTSQILESYLNASDAVAAGFSNSRF